MNNLSEAMSAFLSDSIKNDNVVDFAGQRILRSAVDKLKKFYDLGMSGSTNVKIDDCCLLTTIYWNDGKDVDIYVNTENKELFFLDEDGKLKLLSEASTELMKKIISQMKEIGL